METANKDTVQAQEHHYSETKALFPNRTLAELNSLIRKDAGAEEMLTVNLRGGFPYMNCISLTMSLSHSY